MYTGRSEAACSLEGPVAEASPMEERKAFWAAGEQGDPCPFAFTRTYWFQRRDTLFSRLYQLWMESGAQCSDGPVLPLEQPGDACEASNSCGLSLCLPCCFSSLAGIGPVSPRRHTSCHYERVLSMRLASQFDVRATPCHLCQTPAERQVGPLWEF